MIFALAILLGITVWILLPRSSSQKGFWGFMAALLYLPIGVIMALSKKYK